MSAPLGAWEAAAGPQARRQTLTSALKVRLAARGTAHRVNTRELMPASGRGGLKALGGGRPGMHSREEMAVAPGRCV